MPRSTMYLYLYKGPMAYGFPSGTVGKESTCNARDAGSIPGSGRRRACNPLKYFAWRIPWTESLMGYSPWGGKSDTSEVTTYNTQGLSCVSCISKWILYHCTTRGSLYIYIHTHTHTHILYIYTHTHIIYIYTHTYYIYIYIILIHNLWNHIYIHIYIYRERESIDY